jgi:hypothetical protein
MKTTLVKAPQQGFLRLLLSNLRALERLPVESPKWGAVGLVQAPLIDLYWAADAAEKASPVTVALVQGSCPQHTQMLAIFGKQADVAAALAKIRENRPGPGPRR